VGVNNLRLSRFILIAVGYQRFKTLEQQRSLVITREHPLQKECSLTSIFFLLELPGGGQPQGEIP